MLKIEKTVLPSPEQWEIIIEGMRNAMNSWDKMDSGWDGFGECDGFSLGENDHRLMMNLANGGSTHAKYRRMTPVWITINAPLYWWKEFDTYKVGTVCNSCSTMHKIHSKEFTLEDFSCEHLKNFYGFKNHPHGHELALFENGFRNTVTDLNTARKLFLQTGDRQYWWQMIQLLPTSFNQKRTIFLNYEVLVGMYRDRRNHKLAEWHTFCDWIKSLPYSEIITGE